MLESGERELLKATVHGVACVLLGTFAGYNALAWWRRREAHLACNAVLYAALVAWEANHVGHHVQTLRERRCGS